MIGQTVRIQNELGLHARAAARLVELTSRFKADIRLGKAGGEAHIDGKSILGILLMAAVCGTEIQVLADGSDEEAAMAQIIGLIQNRFGEDR